MGVNEAAAGIIPGEGRREQWWQPLRLLQHMPPLGKASVLVPVWIVKVIRGIDGLHDIRDQFAWTARTQQLDRIGFASASPHTEHMPRTRQVRGHRGRQRSTIEQHQIFEVNQFSGGQSRCAGFTIQQPRHPTFAQRRIAGTFVEPRDGVFGSEQRRQNDVERQFFRYGVGD